MKLSGKVAIVTGTSPNIGAGIAGGSFRFYLWSGGSGPKVTLRLTAQHADAWNAFGPPAAYAEKNRTLDEWCARLERDPRQIERTVGIQASEIDDWEAYLDAGAEHLIVMAGPPFDLDPTRRLLEIARA